MSLEENKRAALATVPTKPLIRYTFTVATGEIVIHATALSKLLSKAKEK